MAPIIAGELPEQALLQRYKREGSYTDCYFMDVPRHIEMSEYISNFYTTPLFKVERKILSLAVGKHSSDDAAHNLAQGRDTNFAAWSVEDRSSNQLLLCDFLGRTRSWLMAEATPSSTRLYFGSAVVPKSKPTSGKASFGFAFHALYGFHHMYTRALMRAAQEAGAWVFVTGDRRVLTWGTQGDMLILSPRAAWMRLFANSGIN
jgi:hypothetical protein